MTRLFLHVDYRWCPIAGGVRRHSWQQVSTNVIIKGCRIKRRLEEDVNVGLTIGFWVRVMGSNHYFIVYCILLFELILSVCVWWWSCNLLQRCSCWYRWVRGYSELEKGQLGDLFMNLFSYGFSYLLCNNFTLTVWITVSVECIRGFDFWRI